VANDVGMGGKFDESAGRPLKVGAFATIPKGVNHFVWTRGETIIQVHGIGPDTVHDVDPDDDPRRAKSPKAPTEIEQPCSR
jgi:hypothetical protein